MGWKYEHEIFVRGEVTIEQACNGYVVRGENLNTTVCSSLGEVFNLFVGLYHADADEMAAFYEHHEGCLARHGARVSLDDRSGSDHTR